MGSACLPRRTLLPGRQSSQVPRCPVSRGSPTGTGAPRRRVPNGGTQSGAPTRCQALRAGLFVLPGRERRDDEVPRRGYASEVLNEVPTRCQTPRLGRVESAATTRYRDGGTPTRCPTRCQTPRLETPRLETPWCSGFRLRRCAPTGWSAAPTRCPDEVPDTSRRTPREPTPREPTPRDRETAGPSDRSPRDRLVTVLHRIRLSAGPVGAMWCQVHLSCARVVVPGAWPSPDRRRGLTVRGTPGSETGRRGE
jgi:hypothetical protein